MSRSGYSDDYDGWSLIRWRGQVASAMRGRRGQKLLKELLIALEAMPAKRLVTSEFEKGGEVCALGAIGKAKGIDMSGLATDDESGAEVIADRLNIAEPMAREIVFMNDEYFDTYLCATPEERWAKMREWVAGQILPEIEI